MKAITLLTVSMFGLAACGETGEDRAQPPAQDVALEQPAAQNIGEGLAHGEGRIVSVDLEGRRVEIDHGPLEGTNMGAMTMFFGTTRNVDLAALASGDEIIFMVKQGRDGSWRVNHVCEQGADMSTCMTEMSH